MAKLFVIPDEARREPLKDSKFYGWLLENKIKENQSMPVIRRYLESLGFIVGTNFISIRNLNLLKIIFSVYWDLEVKNTVTYNISLQELLVTLIVRPGSTLVVKTLQGSFTFIGTSKKQDNGLRVKAFDPLTELAVIENLRVDVLQHQ